MAETPSSHLHEVSEKIQELLSNTEELPQRGEDFWMETRIRRHSSKVIVLSFPMPPGIQAIHGQRLHLETDLRFLRRAGGEKEKIIKIRAELTYFKSYLDEWAHRQLLGTSVLYSGLHKEYHVGAGWEMLVVVTLEDLLQKISRKNSIQDRP